MSAINDSPDAALIGVTQQQSRTVTVEHHDVASFAEVTTDENPLHLDEDHAAQTLFGERIAHGMFVGGLISATLTDLVDPEEATVVYLEQNLEFQKPVYLGDELTARVEVTENLGNNRYRIRTIAETDNGIVVDGDAIILLDA